MSHDSKVCIPAVVTSVPMRIRTQLIVALLLLAVLSLTGIVVFTYVSSRRAVRQTVEAEAAHLTADMDQRLGAVQTVMVLRVR